MNGHNIYLIYYNVIVKTLIIIQFKNIIIQKIKKIVNKLKLFI